MEPELLLMSKVKKGDLEAFDSIVDKYKRGIYNHILLLSGSASSAEELSQQVFLEVFQQSQTFQPKSKFSTYIFSVAHRLCEEALPAQRRKSMPGEEEVKGDVTAKVRAELFRLNRSYREVLILREIQRFNYEEIKEILSSPVERIRTILNRARRVFSKRISRLLE